MNYTIYTKRYMVGFRLISLLKLKLINLRIFSYSVFPKHPYFWFLTKIYHRYSIWSNSIQLKPLKVNFDIQINLILIVTSWNCIALKLHYGTPNFSWAFRQLCKPKQSLNNFILVPMKADTVLGTLQFAPDSFPELSNHQNLSQNRRNK